MSDLQVSGNPRIVRRSAVAPAKKLCPRCLGALTLRTGFDGWIGVVPPHFICVHCGYEGRGYLEPDQGSKTS